MRNIYQNMWHGIRFDSFATLSSTVLADSQFFNSFYKVFFERYKHIDELNPDWVRLKVDAIKRVHDKIFRSKDASILSIGCGLGIQEKVLLELGYSNVEVTEVSEHPLRWIRTHLPADRIHIGLFPSCLPPGRQYDSILFAGIDMFFDEVQWVDFLRQVRTYLKGTGNCTMLGWTLEHEDPFVRAVLKIKDRTFQVLELFRIRHRGQFWGYARTRQEYRTGFLRAGFTELADETIDTGTQWRTYRLTGEAESND